MGNEKGVVLDYTRVSTRKGNSYRITLPRKVVENIGLTPEDNVVVFYLEDGKLKLDRVR